MRLRLYRHRPHTGDPKHEIYRNTHRSTWAAIGMLSNCLSSKNSKRSQLEKKHLGALGPASCRGFRCASCWHSLYRNIHRSTWAAIGMLGALGPASYRGFRCASCWHSHESGPPWGIQSKPKHGNIGFGSRGSALQQSVKNHKKRYEKVTERLPNGTQMASKSTKNDDQMHPGSDLWP